MANGLINKELIMKAWEFLRKNETSIPNETLDFVRDAALEKLNVIETSESNKSKLNNDSNIIIDVNNKICLSHKPLYLYNSNWEVEAEKRHRKGVKQKQCPKCKRWLWKDEM
jgi:hypothetical protein